MNPNLLVRILGLSLLVTAVGCTPSSHHDDSTDDDDDSTGDDDDSAGDDDDSTGNDDDSADDDDTPALLLDLPPGITELSIDQEVEDQIIARSFLLHASPTVNLEANYQVLFAFHGNGGQPQGFVGMLQGLVDSGNVVGVYPKGLSASWNLGQEQSTADDVAFVDLIVNELSSYRQLDVESMVAMGSSNGAGMVHRLGIRTGHFRAIAALSTALTQTEQPKTLSRPVSVLQVHGVNDPVCPYEGGSSPTGHTFHAAEESAALWAQANNCSEGAETTSASGNIVIEFGNCAEGAQVLHYGIEGAGHGLPPDTEGGLIDLIWNFLVTE
jgi:polyhydroxybutyrate depolymerase